MSKKGRIMQVLFACFLLLFTACGQQTENEEKVQTKGEELTMINDREEPLQKEEEIEEAIRQETETVNEVEAVKAEETEPRVATAQISDRIPDKYLKYRTEDGGEIVQISYQTYDYFGDGREITKNANVYLPNGYSEDRSYNVLYLMHGIGGDENEWGMVGKASEVKCIMDNLIYYGDIQPFIVVTPNGRSSSRNGKEGSDYNSFYKFGQELRNDLIPYMDEHFATYSSEGESLSVERAHRAMAGLSMGGMQTINIGIGECVDLFGYFGAFSAAPTSNTAEKTAELLNDNPYEIYYFYNICGTSDAIAYDSAAAAAKNLPEVCSRFDAEKNFMWQEVNGTHNFNVWYLGFYNFAQLAFTQQDKL